MKKFVFIVTLPFLLFLFGCPIGIDYAPGTPGKEKIDADLIGTWHTKSEDASFITAKVTKESDFSFHINMVETGALYGLDETEFTGWCTEIDKQKIIYIKSGGQFFMHGYKLNGSSLSIYDVSLLDGGTDAVVSTEALRKQISTSLKKPDCLNDEIIYTKM